MIYFRQTETKCSYLAYYLSILDNLDVLGIQSSHFTHILAIIQRITTLFHTSLVFFNLIVSEIKYKNNYFHLFFLLKLMVLLDSSLSV